MSPRPRCHVSALGKQHDIERRVFQSAESIRFREGFAGWGGLYNGGVPLGAGSTGDSVGAGVADAVTSLAFASSSSFFSSG